MRLIRSLRPLLSRPRGWRRAAVGSCFALVLLVATARAQTVRWEAAESGMPNAIVLLFENCEPDGQPDLPTIPGVSFTFLGRSESSQFSSGPGGFTNIRTVALSYMVRSRQSAPAQIPAFTVKTNKGAQRVPAFNVTAPGAPLESVASSKLVPERTSIWAGEVFGLTYELSAARRTNPQITPVFDWNAAPLVAEDWTRPEVNESVVGGERRVNVVFRTRAVAKAPNTIKLEAASHVLSIQTGTIGFGIISQPRMEQVSVTSDQPTMEIKPLPAAPAGFSGAVGQFKLVSKVVPEKAAVGEPVTWTLELSGTGNWPDIAGLPSRDVSNDFQVVQPKAKRTPSEGKLFDVVLAEDVVLVPTKPGSYTLGPINFIYFDPKSGTYKTISAPRSTVAITAPAGSPSAGAAPTAGETKSEAGKAAADTATTPTFRPPSTPASPVGIPRDPLPGAASVRPPMPRTTLAMSLLAPVAGLLLFWLWLAVRRARETDPVRARREARDRLLGTLAQLPRAGEAERAPLLLAWQRDAAVLWQLPQAAPPAAALTDANWSTLWLEADRALYSTKNALPADWLSRAQAAVASKRVPGFQPMRLFLPQNLMPFAAAIAFGFVASATVARAAELDGLAAYRSGDFAAAEKGWRKAVEKTPTDWIARHNLSLALAQQERTAEAAAQAAAAFVQKPDDPSVRWHFALATEKAGAAPANLAAFLTPEPLQALGRLMSAPSWQMVLLGSAWGAAFALGWLLLNAYGRRSRGGRWSGIVLLFASVSAGAAAVGGIESYGMAARADAVIVARPSTLRSIPTEADTAQKTSPLAAGSIAFADKTFLGWVRLAFDNGQTGWVRKEDVVPLWR